MSAPSVTTTARLRYLNEAAHLLHERAPASSAALGAQREKVASNNGFLMTSSIVKCIGGDSCGSCGAVLIPGRSCTLAIEDSRARSSQRPPSRRSRTPASSQKADALTALHKQENAGSRRADRMLAYSCSLCNRTTRVPLPAEQHPRKRAAGRVIQPASAAPPANLSNGHDAATAVLRRTENKGEAKAADFESAAAQPRLSETPIASPMSESASAKKRAKARRRGGLQAMLDRSITADASRRKAPGMGLMDFLKPS